MKVRVYLMPDAAERLVKDPAASMFPWDFQCRIGDIDPLNTYTQAPAGGTLVYSFDYQPPTQEQALQAAICGLDAMMDEATKAYHSSIRQFRERKQNLLALTYEAPKEA